MRRLLLLSLLLLGGAASAQTPNYSTAISLANLLGGSTAIASASVCATPADAHGNPLTVSAPTWGVLLRNKPLCGTVLNGALTAPLRVPDACHTNNPTPITYNIAIQPLDTNGNPQGASVTIPAVQNVCSPTYALDTFAPVATAALPPSPAVAAGIGLPTQCTAPSLWIRTDLAAVYLCQSGSFTPVLGTQSLPGTQGPAGAQGIQGVPGPAGAVGPTGPQGLPGVQGPIGPAGPAGPAGAASTVAGPTGPQGIQGIAGPAGAVGPMGPTGLQGIQGMIGPAGAASTVPGPAGATGAAGPAGAIGAQGIQGLTGATGAAGSAGAIGSQGPTGAPGATGAQGIQGLTGATGAAGPTGPAGGGITAAQATTAGADGAIAASQTAPGNAADAVAAANTAPNQVINVGVGVAHNTVIPLFPGSVIHDIGPGYEGHRYYNPPNQQKMHDVRAADGNAAQWNHVTFDVQPPSYFGQQMLRSETLWSFGAASNYSSAWRSVVLSSLALTIANRGIGGATNIFYHKQAAGDSNVLNMYSYFDAGWNTQSDEGMTGLRNYVTQNATYWHGTSGSSGTGVTLPLLSDATSGQNYTIDGTILLDISKGTIAGTITGGASALAGSSYLTTYPTSLTNLPLTTAWGICNVNFPLPSQATPQVNTPFTCTATLKAGTFTAGGLVWVAGPNYPEQAAITAVGTPSGGTQSITVSVRNPQPDGATKGVAIFQSGLVGRYASWDANLAQPAGLRTTQYAFGSLDGVNLITAFYATGGTGARYHQPPGCNAQAFCPGVAARNGFHLYPGAEIVANLSLGHTPQLEPNGIVFSAGDLLENPPSDAVYMTGYKGACTQVTPSNDAASVCNSVVIGGQGAVANFYAHYTQNYNNPAMYSYNGGLYDAPTFHRVAGYFDQGLTFDLAPGHGVINITAMNINDFLGDGQGGPESLTLFNVPGSRLQYYAADQTFYADNFKATTFATVFASAPGGSCGTNQTNRWAFTQDGHVVYCGAPYTTVNGVTTGVWQQPLDAAGAAAAVLATSAQRSANLSDLASPSTARTNLGLGAAATHGASTAVNGVALTLDGTASLPQPWSVQPQVYVGGTAIPAKTYTMTLGRNDRAVPLTLTGFWCHADAGASTMTVANSAGTPFLTAPIACGTGFTAGTQTATVTLAVGDWLVWTFVADGVSTQIAGDTAGCSNAIAGVCHP